MNQVLTRYLSWTALGLAWVALFAALLLGDHRAMWICALSAFSAGFLAFDSAATLMHGLVHWVSEAARQDRVIDSVPTPPPPPVRESLAPLSRGLPVYRNQRGELKIDHDAIKTENSEAGGSPAPPPHPFDEYPPYADPDLQTDGYGAQVPDDDLVEWKQP